MCVFPKFSYTPNRRASHGGLVYMLSQGKCANPYTPKGPRSPGRPVQSSVAPGHWCIFSGPLYLFRRDYNGGRSRGPDRSRGPTSKSAALARTQQYFVRPAPPQKLGSCRLLLGGRQLYANALGPQRTVQAGRGSGAPLACTAFPPRNHIRQTAARSTAVWCIRKLWGTHTNPYTPKGPRSLGQPVQASVAQGN